jgi:cell wall-associated NlpC family hydrolase
MRDMWRSRLRGRRLPSYALAAALTVSLLGLAGGSGAPVAADSNSSDASSGPAQQGGGNLPQSDAEPAAPGGPQQAGGGNLPGQKPGDAATGDGAPPASTTDAAPPVDPGFVDDYTRVWKQVVKGKQEVRGLTRDLATAHEAVAASVSDLTLALRVRNRADFELSGAESDFTVAVHDMYVSGTTDVDVILGVLGSKPDDVLRNIDAIVYLRSATGKESADYDVAQRSALNAESAAASALIRAEQDRARADKLAARLAKAKKDLKQNQKELQKLVSVAAPQTVVGPNGCPKAVLEGTVPEGIDINKLCKNAVKHAPSPQAAFAIKWALVRLGAPYACEGIGRLEAWRYDCSSYVSRAYAEGAGLKTAGDGWAPSTRNMVPWDGASLDPHYAVIPPAEIRPGDLVLYDTCPTGETCPYRHVVMYLGPLEKGGVPMMAHTNACGTVAHVEAFTGTDVPNLLGVRRVVPLAGEKIVGSVGKVPKPDGTGKKPKKPKKPTAA